MFDATSPCDTPAPHIGQDTAVLQRSEGEVRLAFRRQGRKSVLSRLYQKGAAKARLPQSQDPSVPEAVLLNTAGGIAGGDRFTVDVQLAKGAAALITTQAAEKVYRTLGPRAEIHNRVRIAGRARLEWLPQETIMFDQARLTRWLDIDMSEDAELIAMEAVVFGRTAMGERVQSGNLTDGWRVRRAGRLVFVDALRLNGPINDRLAGQATAGGAVALAMVICATPRAADLLDNARAALASVSHATGASCWNGLVVARLAAPNGLVLRQTLVHLLTALRGGVPLPRVWQC